MKKEKKNTNRTAARATTTRWRRARVWLRSSSLNSIQPHCVRTFFLCQCTCQCDDAKLPRFVACNLNRHGALVHHLWSPIDHHFSEPSELDGNRTKASHRSRNEVDTRSRKVTSHKHRHAMRWKTSFFMFHETVQCTRCAITNAHACDRKLRDAFAAAMCKRCPFTARQFIYF